MFGFVKNIWQQFAADQAASAAMDSWDRHLYAGEMLVIAVAERCAVVKGGTTQDPELFRKLAATLADYADSIEQESCHARNT